MNAHTDQSRADVSIRPLPAGARSAAARVLDEAVGAGFWGFDGPGGEVAFVAEGAAKHEAAGVVLARLEPPGDPDALLAFDGPARAPEGALLHVRAIAVAPEARRLGIARRLLAAAEAEAVAQGAAAAYLFAWLPAGQPEPAAVPFYLAAGYAPRPDIPDFYAPGSIASGAECPYCGAPPCRCAARPYVKPLGAG